MEEEHDKLQQAYSDCTTQNERLTEDLKAAQDQVFMLSNHNKELEANVHNLQEELQCLQEEVNETSTF